MYGNGLYWDSSMESPIQTKDDHFTKLMNLHLDKIDLENENRFIEDEDCQTDKKHFITAEWFHELSKGYLNPFNKGDFKEGHIKMLFVQDQKYNEGYHISHSMRMPGLKGRTFLQARTNPSQHAFCNNLKTKEDINLMIKILKETKARPAASNFDQCPSFEPVTTQDASTLACEKEFSDACKDEYSKLSKDELLKDPKGGSKIISTILNSKLVHKATIDHCMVKKNDKESGPVQLGAFKVFSFIGRPKSPCRNYDNLSWNFLKTQPTHQQNADNYAILDQCYAKNYGIEQIEPQKSFKIGGPKVTFDKDAMDFCPNEETNQKEKDKEAEEKNNQEETKTKLASTSKPTLTKQDVEMEPSKPIVQSQPPPPSPTCNKVRICSFNDFGLDPWLVVARHYNKLFYVSTDQVSFPSLIGKTHGVAVIDHWNKPFSGTKRAMEVGEPSNKLAKMAGDGDDDDDGQAIVNKNENDILVSADVLKDIKRDKNIEKNIKEDDIEAVSQDDSEPLSNKIRKTHEKIMVSADGSILCLGDSNRNEFSVHHAGSIYCLETTKTTNPLGKMVLDMIGGYNSYRELKFDSQGAIEIEKSRMCLANTAGIFYALDTVSPDIKLENTNGRTKLIGLKSEIKPIYFEQEEVIKMKDGPSCFEIKENIRNEQTL
ncbi:hypothetical protein DFA_11548 [Cavenderia fasciculata]|uniref:Uncharacterized protein n=1 Tax=Cavenderia fasciculata TaxID=261658 RepID=F4QDJ0_CACFS|nr:uncharacterized protein DFA_11548 [Cavenderia fasciculata]EGG13787.1 hypothetical protein DFA_11548 [Cavenderia fasciculata]|eukprot:XP_004350495.1 hypothetical protein DFA_11548 [Cavenderia fasciculata]